MNDLLFHYLEQKFSSKKFIMRFLFLLLCLFNLCYAQQTYQPTAANLQARKEFQDAKFGMFIHWGVYSVMADGEWVMYTKKIPYKQYTKLPPNFNPIHYNAENWVLLAKEAGMKYITITSRHHDGFSMFDTKASDYNIIKATPFRRDPLKELADACKKHGLKLNFYYSLLDWGRKDYGFGKKIVNGQPEQTDWNSYINFMKQQLTELLTNYGEIGAIWFDGHWERKNADWHLREIYDLIHRLQPACLVGNNHHINPIEGEDYQMFEKDLPGKNSHGWGTGSVSNLPLETCETINRSWGFNILDTNYKSVRALAHYIVKAAGNNANFLLNVGPMADGTIQQEFVDTLRKLGQWMNQYGATIYNTRSGIIQPGDWGVSTTNGKENYLHILDTGNQPYLILSPVDKKIISIKGYKSGKAIRYKQIPEALIVYTNELDTGEIDNVLIVDAK
jgi:alpha-L-fucosidase